MMDQDKTRDFRRKKYPNLREKEEKPIKRTIILMKAKDTDKINSNKNEEGSIPTILLKTRDGENRAVSPQTSSARNKDSDAGPAYQLAPRIPVTDLSNLLSGPTPMKISVKLLDDETQMIQDGFLEFLTESTDFLVVGCIGSQGVGKSTLMSHLAKLPDDPFDSESLIFKKQSKLHIDSSSHCTEGIDAFITNERVILLDSQPILSLSVLVRHYNCEGNLSARSCSRDDPDYPCLENDMELLALQYMSFLLTVCHVVVFVIEDTGHERVLRFLQTAEIVKPPTTLHSEDDMLVEYFPHVLIVHNKTDNGSFNKHVLHKIQDEYKTVFNQSQLPIQSGTGIANGYMLKSLTSEIGKSDPINLFLLPRFQKELPPYENVNYIDLLKDLRLQLYGLAPTPLTHTLLTEKNWWHYAVKIWEDIKKSTLFPEFGRFLPSPSSVKAEFNQT